MSSRKKLNFNSVIDQIEKTPNTEDNINYEPIHFLRVHSKNNDSADIQTSVWQCAFEPDPVNSKLTTNILATCGGNSICLIDIQKGIVKKKFIVKKKKNSETIYTIAWTTIKSIDGNYNILVGGGFEKTIYFLDPENCVLFHEFKININSKSTIISAFLFHPEESSVLFCGLNDGRIFVFDIGVPSYPKYNSTVNQLYLFDASFEVNSICYSSANGILLAACNSAIFGWAVTHKPLSLKSEPKKLTFNLNLSKSQKHKIVDSIEVLDNDMIACKYALHGTIYIWNLRNVLRNNPDQTCFQFTPLHILKWSNTDNFYLNMGSSAGLLACGDDKGAIWIYNINQLESSETQKNHEPLMIMPWPEVTDRYLIRKRKLTIDTYDIVLNKTILSPQSGKYLVSVTANNLVCIWMRTDNFEN